MKLLHQKVVNLSLYKVQRNNESGQFNWKIDKIILCSGNRYQAEMLWGILWQIHTLRSALGKNYQNNAKDNNNQVLWLRTEYECKTKSMKIFNFLMIIWWTNCKILFFLEWIYPISNSTENFLLLSEFIFNVIHTIQTFTEYKWFSFILFSALIL